MWRDFEQWAGERLPQSADGTWTVSEVAGLKDHAEFARLVVALFRELGFEAQTVDVDGADVAARRVVDGDRQTVLVATGWYQGGRTVAASEVAELAAARDRMDADRALFVTSGTFHPGAITRAEDDPGLDLLAGASLVDLLDRTTLTPPDRS